MATTDVLLSKEELTKTVKIILGEYFGDFLNNNLGNRCTNELITGLNMIVTEKIIQGLDPWIPKEEKKED